MPNAAGKQRWGMDQRDRDQPAKSPVAKPDAWAIKPSAGRQSIGPFLKEQPKIEVKTEVTLSAPREIKTIEPAKAPSRGVGALIKPKVDTQPKKQEEPPKELKALEPPQPSHGVGALIEKPVVEEVKIETEVKLEQPKQRDWAIGDGQQRRTTGEDRQRAKQRPLSDELKSLISVLSSAGEANVSGAVDTIRKILSMVGAAKQGGNGNDQATASAIREAAQSLRAIADAIARPWKVKFDKDGMPTGIEKQE